MMEIQNRLEDAEEEYLYANQEDITIKFGEIKFIKKKFTIKFKCNFCDKNITSFKRFLCHTLTHIYTVDGSTMEALIKRLLQNQDEDTKNCINITQNRNTNDLQTCEIKCASESDFAQNNGLIQKKESETIQFTEGASVIDDYEQILLEIGTDNCLTNELGSEEVLHNETETRLEIEFLQTVNTNSDETITKQEENNMPLTEESKQQNKNKKYPCEICSMVLTSPGNLRKHHNRHFGVRTHLCSTCGKAFFTSTELNTHIRSHTGEKPFVCIECGASYKTSSHLLSHRRRHSNIREHKCNDCGKAFFDKMLLKNHQQTHSTDRKFKCECCDKNFITYNSLRQHRKIHITKTKNECKYCHKDCVQFTALQSHMKLTHGVEVNYEET